MCVQSKSVIVECIPKLDDFERSIEIISQIIASPERSANTSKFTIMVPQPTVERLCHLVDKLTNTLVLFNQTNAKRSVDDSCLVGFVSALEFAENTAQQVSTVLSASLDQQDESELDDELYRLTERQITLRSKIRSNREMLAMVIQRYV